jgi:hypothetical protein
MKTVLKRMAIVMLTAVCLLGLAPASSLFAADPVVLILEGEGSTPWSISNIAPGDSGVKTLTVRNGGTVEGSLSIWISNIVDIEGLNPEAETGNTDEPGELSDYLRLTVSAQGINTSITMPALLSEFPQSSGGARYIRIPSLAPGESVALTWEWELPLETGNIVQGDEVSFDINYLLEQVVTTTTSATTTTTSPIVTTTATTTTSETTTTTATTSPTTTTTSPVATTATITTTRTITTTSIVTTTDKSTATITTATTITATATYTTIINTTPTGKDKLIANLFGNVLEYDTDDQGAIMQPIEISSGDGALTLTISGGTRAQDEDGNPATVIIARIMEDPPPPPEDAHMIGLAYELISDATSFDPPLMIKFHYSDGDIPEGLNEEDMYIAYYDKQVGEWVSLEGVVDTGNNIITAYVSHFTDFCVIIPSTSQSNVIITGYIPQIITVCGEVMVLTLIVVLIYFVRTRHYHPSLPSPAV